MACVIVFGQHELLRQVVCLSAASRLERSGAQTENPFCHTPFEGMKRESTLSGRRFLDGVHHLTCLKMCLCRRSCPYKDHSPKMSCQTQNDLKASLDTTREREREREIVLAWELHPKLLLAFLGKPCTPSQNCHFGPY